MNIPTYLHDFAKKCEETDFVQIMLFSTAGNDLLEVWYYGALFEVAGEPQPYIVDSDTAPAKIIAKDAQTGEEIVLFDGAHHGYNNMFCDEYEEDVVEHRPLVQYNIPASKLKVELGYGIDYDEEKDDYEFDSQGNVVLIDGSTMAWEEVKCNGFDYLGLSFRNETGEYISFANFELA